MADLGCVIRWSQRRANLLVEGFDLPQQEGAECVSGRCCSKSRSDAIRAAAWKRSRPGLKAALTPDWRCGALAKVIEGGTIAIGDMIALEE